MKLSIISILQAGFKRIKSRISCGIINILDLDEILEMFSPTLLFYLHKDNCPGVPKTRGPASPCPPALGEGYSHSSWHFPRVRKVSFGEMLIFSHTRSCSSFFSSCFLILPPPSVYLAPSLSFLHPFPFLFFFFLHLFLLFFFIFLLFLLCLSFFSCMENLRIGINTKESRLP